MRSSSREEIVEVLDSLEADYKRALDLTFDALTTPERLAVLESLERFRRWQPTIEHPLINQLSERLIRPSWAASWPPRWRIGCVSAAPKLPDVCTKPPTSASGAR